MAGDVLVSSLQEFEDGERRLVDVGGERVGVFRRGDRFYAYADRCPHQGGPVCQGIVVGRVEAVLDDRRQVLGERFSESELHLVCPWHGYEYDLTSGRCCADARLRLAPFEVFVREGGVYVRG